MSGSLFFIVRFVGSSLIICFFRFYFFFSSLFHFPTSISILIFLFFFHGNFFSFFPISGYSLFGNEMNEVDDKLCTVTISDIIKSKMIIHYYFACPSHKSNSNEVNWGSGTWAYEVQSSNRDIRWNMFWFDLQA